ncbi:hypothetical protein MMC07_008866 [Pseudocyphellaria aurata]|nr:hypothetical protein [Pseudocyphellaria aurata]
MLSDFLKSSLKIYKDDTDSVANWLAVTAKQCGYSSDLLDRTDQSSSLSSNATPSQSSTRLKGKARKKAKEAAAAQGNQSGASQSQTAGKPPAKASYIIKVKDFIPLAEFIAGSSNPVVKVPAYLVGVLNRAIELRGQHNAQSREGNDPDDASKRAVADETHSYFMAILERTREILKPRMPPGMIGDVLCAPSLELGGLGEKATAQTRNMFDKLDIQEPSQEFLDTPDVTPAPTPISSNEHRYTAETLHSPEEQYLAAQCLFQDVRQTRGFLRRLWTMYRESRFELTAASITTNTAIGFIRELEQDYLQQFPEQSDYESIVNMFFGVQCLAQGEDPAYKQRPDDSFNFKVYGLAEECLLSTYVLLSSVQDVISPGHLPIYKPGHFGHRDLRSNWSQKSPREKFQDDKLVLLEAFPDLMLMTMITSRSPLAEDELIRGFRDMAPGKDIPLCLVFAAQCFLDVQHVLEQDVSRAHEQLVKAATCIRASIEQNMKFHESLRIVNWPKSNDLGFTDMLRVTEEWVLRDMIAEKLKKIQRNMPIPDAEPCRLLKQYPLLCGLFTFALKMRAQEISLAFANAWGSILYTSQLYNAARQEKLLLKPWKDMELLIALHSPEKFFAGDRPKGLEEYFKRFLLSMGYSAAIFASNRRRDIPIASARGPRSLGGLCEVGELFAGRYCNNDQNVAWTRESIQRIIDAKVDDDSEDSESDSSHPNINAADKKTDKKTRKVKRSATGSLINKPKGDQRSTTTLDFLEDLANALQAESLELSVDYLRMHRFCWMLLRSVNDACRPKLLEIYGGGYLEKENQLPFVVGYIFMTATQTSRVANLLLPKRGDFEISSRLLAKAAKQIEDMIDTGAGAIEIKVLEEFGGYRLDFGEMPDDWAESA